MLNRPQRTWRKAAAVGAAVLLAGCGSTVQQTGATATDQGLGGSTGTSTPSTTGTGDGFATTGFQEGPSQSTTGTSGPGVTGSSADGINAGGTGSSGGIGPTSGAAGAPTTRPLKVGVTAVDYSKVFAAFGLAAPTGDPYASYKNLIAYLNKHGGLAGRQVQADYYSIDGAASDSASAVQAACTHFTQDRRVDIVLSVGLNNSQGFSECLLKFGIPQFDSGQYAEDATSTARTPNQFTPAALAHDRMATSVIKIALARGWLTKKDVLGVVAQNCSVDQRVYARQIAPAAKAAGVKVVLATVNCINGNADIGAAAGQIQSAVLKFRTDGVTQVTMPGAPEGAGVLLFSQNASQQKYYPGYLLTSNSFAYDNSNSTWPKDQLSKMKGIGFSPLLDVGLQAKVTPRQAKAQAACKAMDPSRGGADSSSQPTAFLTGFYGICDTFRLLGTMLTATRGAVTVPGFVKAYLQAAGAAASAKLFDGTFATQGGRRDGAGVVVPFSFKPTGCQCMSFDGAPTPA